MDTCDSGGLVGIVCKIGNLFDYILPVLITLGVLYFIYGVVMYVIAGGEEAKTKGKDSIIYGLIGLAVIVAMWGLIYIIVDTFGVEDSPAPSSGYLRGLLPS